MHIHMQTIASRVNKAFAFFIAAVLCLMRRELVKKNPFRPSMMAVIVTACRPYVRVLPVAMNLQTTNIATQVTLAMCMCMTGRGALLRSVS